MTSRLPVLSLLLAIFCGAAAASLNGNEPAHSGYRMTEEDFRVFEKGLLDAEKVSSKLFPRGIVGNDAVLYDTHDIFIYSGSSAYTLPKFRHRDGYQIYRISLGRPVSEREMARCAAGPGPASVEVLRTITERSFSCAPWGVFGRIQKERGSPYRFVEGYWASMIHEFGHMYRDRFQADPTSEMLAIEGLLSTERLSPGTDQLNAADEGFATWCELTGSKKLYPAHYQRMLDSAHKRRGTDDEYGHDAGLRAAIILAGKKS